MHSEQQPTAPDCILSLQDICAGCNTADSVEKWPFATFAIFFKTVFLHGLITMPDTVQDDGFSSVDTNKDGVPPAVSLLPEVVAAPAAEEAAALAAEEKQKQAKEV